MTRRPGGVIERFGATGLLFGGLVLATFCWVANASAQSSASSQPAAGLRATWVAKGTSSAAPVGTVQHSRSLASPVLVADAAAGNAAAATGQTVLRWRTPSISQTRMPASADSRDDIGLAVSVSGITSETATVRPVGFDQSIAEAPSTVATRSESDPFQDPFGDHLQRRPVPAQPLLGTTTTKLTPTPAPIAAQPVARSAIQDDPPPEPLPEPTRAVVDQLKPVAQDCTRVYNQRDCCKEDGRCQMARDEWHHSAISKISLDITPSFRPDEDDLFKEETLRDRELSKAPVRTWRDRRGAVLATGRLTNIKRGRLLILDDHNDVVKLRFEDLCDDDLCFLTSWWGVPTECTLGDAPFAGRNWMPMSFTWKASAVCSKPLYFQETALERYGHTAGPIRQPILSGAHFFMSLVTLPYQTGINPLWECRYPLGYYRPGNCAPYFLPPIPLSVRGGLLEAGAWIGGIYLIP